MVLDWMRRAVLALASGAALVLAGCGSSTIESQFHPTRVVAFGDAFTDAGQNGGRRYTVNATGAIVWVENVAAQYALPLAPSAAGGTDYAYGNARIAVKPDVAGNAATPTVQDQVGTFLAAGAPSTGDLIILGAGTSDIVAEVVKFRAGAQTNDQMVANVKQAARDLAAQAKRLVAAGATHVVVVPPYDLSKSGWAVAIQQQPLLATVSSDFTQELLVDLVDQGQNVLYIDTPLIFNLMAGNPSTYGLVDPVSPVCRSVDPGPGIGLGAEQINSSLCTADTLIPGALYTQYLFADLVYPTPIGHQRFGEYAYGRITSRW